MPLVPFTIVPLGEHVDESTGVLEYRNIGDQEIVLNGSLGKFILYSPRESTNGGEGGQVI